MITPFCTTTLDIQYLLSKLRNAYYDLERGMTLLQDTIDGNPDEQVNTLLHISTIEISGVMKMINGYKEMLAIAEKIEDEEDEEQEEVKRIEEEEDKRLEEEEVKRLDEEEKRLDEEDEEIRFKEEWEEQRKEKWKEEEKRLDEEDEDKRLEEWEEQWKEKWKEEWKSSRGYNTMPEHTIGKEEEKILEEEILEEKILEEERIEEEDLIEEVDDKDLIADLEKEKKK